MPISLTQSTSSINQKASSFDSSKKTAHSITSKNITSSRNKKPPLLPTSGEMPSSPAVNGVLSPQLKITCGTIVDKDSSLSQSNYPDNSSILSPTSAAIVSLSTSVKNVFMDVFCGAKSIINNAVSNSSSIIISTKKLMVKNHKGSKKPTNVSDMQKNTSPLSSSKSSSGSRNSSCNTSIRFSLCESPVLCASSTSVKSSSSTNQNSDSEDMLLSETKIYTDNLCPPIGVRLVWFSPLEVLDYCTKNIVLNSALGGSSDLLDCLNYYDEVNFYRFSLMLNSEKDGDWVCRLIDTFIDDYFYQNYHKRIEPAISTKTAFSAWVISLSSDYTHDSKITIGERISSKDAVNFCKFTQFLCSKINPESIDWNMDYITPFFHSDSYSDLEKKEMLLQECCERLLANLVYNISFNLIIVKKYRKEQYHLDIGLRQSHHTEIQSKQPTLRSHFLWNRASSLLYLLDKLHSPYEKIKAIYYACVYLQEWVLLLPANCSGADDFFPTLISLIESIKAPSLLLHLRYIEEYRSIQPIDQGLLGYYLTSFDAAMKYLSSPIAQCGSGNLSSIISESISTIGDQIKHLFFKKKTHNISLGGRPVQFEHDNKSQTLNI